MKLACEHPVKLDKIDKPIGRCGRCLPCQTMRRLEWTNRMTLENFGLEYKPLFVTCSYAPAYLPNNYSECIRFTQKWIKRLRKRLNGSVRYFLATEKGDKNGRLHQHLIMWIPEIAHLGMYDKWSILYDTWGAGRLECQEVRSSAAFYYTAKYLQKNVYDQGKSEEWSRHEGKFIKSGRLYTWSQKPPIGSAGVDRWKYITQKWHEAYPEQVPPNWFHMFVLGKLQKVYIPRRNYVDHVQKTLGISLSPIKNTIAEPLIVSPLDRYRYATWQNIEEEDIKVIQT